MLTKLGQWPNIREIYFNLNLSVEIHDLASAINLSPPSINNKGIDWISVVVTIAPDFLIIVYSSKYTGKTERKNSAFRQSHALINSVDIKSLNTVYYLYVYSITVGQLFPMSEITAYFFINNFLELHTDVTLVVSEREESFTQVNSTKHQLNYVYVVNDKTLKS